MYARLYEYCIYTCKLSEDYYIKLVILNKGKGMMNKDKNV